VRVQRADPDAGRHADPGADATPQPGTDLTATAGRRRRDCDDANAAIHPGAADAPDLSFVDSNCDGIDGDESQAVFVATTGATLRPAPERSRCSP
jgi:hypothetical protein